MTYGKVQTNISAIFAEKVVIFFVAPFVPKFCARDATTHAIFPRCQTLYATVVLLTFESTTASVAEKEGKGGNGRECLLCFSTVELCISFS